MCIVKRKLARLVRKNDELGENGNIWNMTKNIKNGSKYEN